jgi:hypothetical protein
MLFSEDILPTEQTDLPTCVAPLVRGEILVW